MSEKTKLSTINTNIKEAQELIKTVDRNLYELVEDEVINWQQYHINDRNLLKSYSLLIDTQNILDTIINGGSKVEPK